MNKKNKTIWITIGIPTYNGSSTIKSVLESIEVALQKIPKGEVEILVSDNCSTDNTSAIYEEYSRKSIIPIRYSKNKTNIGFDGNVNAMVKNS